MSSINWDTPEIADRYDRNSDHQFKKGVTLIEMMKIKAGDMVLDVGCGTGRQAMHVSDIVGPDGKLFGLDPSSYRIQIATGKAKDHSLQNMSFTVGRAEDLSGFSDYEFDHVYFCSSFHWVDDKKTALKEVYRVLKPGGSVGMTTLDRNNSLTMDDVKRKLALKYPFLGQEKTDEGGKKRVTKDELQALFDQAGFVGASIELRSIRKEFRTPEEFLEFGRANSHEGFMDNVPAGLQEQVRSEIKEELKKKMAASGSDLQSNTLFAIARKP
jgi:arsenite methyltransferase